MLHDLRDITLGILAALVVAAGLISWAEQIETWWRRWRKRSGTGLVLLFMLASPARGQALRKITEVAIRFEGPLSKEPSLRDSAVNQFKRTIGVKVADTARDQLVFAYTFVPTHIPKQVIGAAAAFLRAPVVVHGDTVLAIVWGPTLNYTLVPEGSNQSGTILRQFSVVLQQFIADYRSTQMPVIRKP